MPTPGHFILHARAVPPLGAGDYVLTGAQEVAGGPTEPYTGHVRVTSPRYRMPPEQILSTFPPANSEGAYEARLPQIVLRRRTLPWERIVDPAHREIPWLALVVIAEGEGSLSGDTPVAGCVTPGLTLPGPNDVATGVYLSVTRTVVDHVFPTVEDLPLLTHVREVDIDDTELAMGDDDGLLAVVIANRLPQFDRVACKPIRYLACLINLEGQLPVLPAPTTLDESVFTVVAAVQDLRALASVMAEAQPATSTDAFAMGRSVISQLATAPVVAKSAVADAWRAVPREIERLAVSAAPDDAPRLVRDAMGAGFRLPIDAIARLEPIYRFPVLTHWSFTCTGMGDFETLVHDLDVGLLGTTPPDPKTRRLMECLPPVDPSKAPPPAPSARPAPEFTETGHVGLDHRTRRGDGVRAWYRGPFTLHVTQRDTPELDGHLGLAHTSDQLRRVVPDGREDLALAAAFEIGRLLALSKPSVVAALMRWRREQFGAERARRLTGRAMAGIDMLAPLGEAALADLGQLVGRRFVLQAAEDPARVLAPPRPLVDPGRPLRFESGDLDSVIAAGFGISLDRVRVVTQEIGLMAALHEQAVPVASSPADTAGLRSALDEAVQAMGAAVRQSRAESPARAGLEGDALDQLLRRKERHP